MDLTVLLLSLVSEEVKLHKIDAEVIVMKVLNNLI